MGECAVESGRSKQRPYGLHDGKCEIDQGDASKGMTKKTRDIHLTPYDPETERALEIAAKAAKKYRRALRILAHSARRK